MNLSKDIYAAVRRIPLGRVATYVDISRAIGRPKAWRRVGTVLSLNRDSKTPCHRVVRSDGKVGGFGYPGGTARKIKKLNEEGIEIEHARINLHRFRIKSPRILRH